MQGVERYKVRLLPHDDAWDDEFHKVQTQIRHIWADSALNIQHIGSTAVKSICAKPILDIAVVVPSLQEMDITSMERAGYEYCGFQNTEQTRCLFVLRGTNEISLRHIHCYEPGDDNFRQCVLFRDYCNSHPEAAQAYDTLKQQLAQLYPDDRAAYTNGKAAFIQDICRKAEHTEAYT